MGDRIRRSLAKTMSWRVIATFMTMVGFYLITGDFALSISSGLGLNILKGIAYYGHERLWERIRWGKHKH
ncbi:MAG: DUF2061 domain-containing protein [Nanoarchaeota archaeon]|nr:DUF2061 domain-containing protein [Nanoarchaeota archaeon]